MLKLRLLLAFQLQFDNLLHAVLRQYRRNAYRHVVDAIFAVKNARYRQRPVAAGEDIAADLRDSARDAIFRTAFAGVNLKAQLAYALGKRCGI